MSNITATRIKQLRKGKRMTLDDLAKATDSSKSYIWELEKGNYLPSAEKVVKLAAALQVTTDYLLIEDAPQPRNRLIELERRVTDLERFLVL